VYTRKLFTRYCSRQRQTSEKPRAFRFAEHCSKRLRRKCPVVTNVTTKLTVHCLSPFAFEYNNGKEKNENENECANNGSGPFRARGDFGTAVFCVCAPSYRTTLKNRKFGRNDFDANAFNKIYVYLRFRAIFGTTYNFRFVFASLLFIWTSAGKRWKKIDEWVLLFGFGFLFTLFSHYRARQ